MAQFSCIRVHQGRRARPLRSAGADPAQVHHMSRTVPTFRGKCREVNSHGPARSGPRAARHRRRASAPPSARARNAAPHGARARAPSAARAVAPSASAAPIASASASASPAGTRQPVRSCGGTAGGASTVSGTAPRSDTTTGVPIACASTAERPKASGSVDGTVTTEAARKAAGMSAQWPTRRTMPFELARADQGVELPHIGVAPLRVAGEHEARRRRGPRREAWRPPRPEPSGPSSPSAARRGARSARAARRPRPCAGPRPARARPPRARRREKSVPRWIDPDAVRRLADRRERIRSAV